MAKKVAIIGGIGIVIVVLMIGAIAMAVVSILEENNSADTGMIIPIEINGTFKGGEFDLTLTGDGIKVTGIEGTGDSKGGSAKNKRNKGGTTELELPKGGGANLTNGFSYMPAMRQENYSMSLWKGYNGYKLANNKIPGKKMVKDSNGLARVNGDYVIALGSAYHGGGGSVGYQRYRVTVQNNGVKTSFTAILGDCKADKDTDKTNRYHLSDGSVVEFHTYHRDPATFTNPNRVFPGKLVKLEKIGGQAVTLDITINGSEVSITGDMDGVPLSTSGTYKNGEIKTSGLLGIVGEGKGTEAMVTWAIKMAQGINSHGYSQANRTCSLCHGGNNHDYDCSSFVTAALAHNNMGADFVNACKTWPYSTSTIGNALKKNGWKNLGKLSRGQLKRGDIVLAPGQHVEIYCGNNLFVGARNDKDGKKGESRQEEVTIDLYGSNFWTQVWRYGGGE